MFLLPEEIDSEPSFKSNIINKVVSENGFKSKNINDEYFTNFLNSDKQKNYDKMRGLYNNIINNDCSFINKDYICDELYDNGKVFSRLVDIINYENNTTISKNDVISHVFKLKNKDDRKLHIYLSVVNDTAELILIDLFHLSMPSDIWKNGIKVRKGSLDETKKVYEKYKNYGYNLSNVLNDDN